MLTDVTRFSTIFEDFSSPCAPPYRFSMFFTPCAAWQAFRDCRSGARSIRAPHRQEARLRRRLRAGPRGRLSIKKTWKRVEHGSKTTKNIKKNMKFVRFSIVFHVSDESFRGERLGTGGPKAGAALQRRLGYHADLDAAGHVAASKTDGNRMKVMKSR